MHELGKTSPFHRHFTPLTGTGGQPRLDRIAEPPATMADPDTGRELRIATVQMSGAICPACERRGDGAYVSFEADLRLVFACPHCRDLVWIHA